MTALVDHWHRLPHSVTAARVCMGISGVACLMLAARVLVLAISAPVLPLASAAETPTPLSGASPREPVARWHLFGLPSQAPQQTMIASTNSGLILRGTVASANPSVGTAFIADAQGKEGVYRVGGSVPGGGTLEAVYAGRVILLNNGQREVLSLAGRQSGSDGMGGNQTAATPSAAAPDGGFITSPLAVGSPDLQTRREQLAPDVARLAEEANVVPVIDNGRMIGVRISAPDPAMLDRLGLQVDDVVTSVNGIELNDPGLAAALQNQMRVGGLITLVVRRGGQDLTISLGL